MEKGIYRPVAVDTVILAIGVNGLEVVLVKIKDGKNVGKWAIPGRLVSFNETLDEAALKIVHQGVTEKRVHMDQMYCFGDLERDRKNKSVSVVYYVLLANTSELRLKSTDLYDDIKWFSTDKLPQMAFDHKNIIKVAREKLAYKLDEIKIIKTLLPSKFTLGELQKVHEVLLNKKIDKRNFIKKIKNEGNVIATKEMKTGGAHRPAKLFRFK